MQWLAGKSREIGSVQPGAMDQASLSSLARLRRRSRVCRLIAGCGMWVLRLLSAIVGAMRVFALDMRSFSTLSTNTAITPKSRRRERHHLHGWQVERPLINSAFRTATMSIADVAPRNTMNARGNFMSGVSMVPQKFSEHRTIATLVRWHSKIAVGTREGKPRLLVPLRFLGRAPGQSVGW